jgi:hypothetical protein
MRDAVGASLSCQVHLLGRWTVDLAEPESAESQHFFLAEGRCEGRISGRFLGANHPHRRMMAPSRPISRAAFTMLPQLVQY